MRQLREAPLLVIDESDGPRYDLSYTEDGVYARAVRLLVEHAPREGVHLDLGCGFGAIAEPVQEHGLTYVGMDLDDAGLADLRRRGFDTVSVDLRDVPKTLQVVDEVLRGRPLASISLLDTLEHVTTGLPLLAELRSRATGSNAVLVVSVPNIAHRDIALKLLSGRFDYTTTGLLDSTHLVHHTSDLLDRVMMATGWGQVGSDDLRLPWSDQHFPADHVLLAPESLVHRFLTVLRDSAGPHAETSQFIRAYLPGAPKDLSLVVDRDGSRDQQFLTVVVRTQGRRPTTLRDALLCLQAQTCQDFEVVVVVHNAGVAEYDDVIAAVRDLPPSLHDRTRMLIVRGGGRARPLNEAVGVAQARYIAVLDDDDLVFAHWVESFKNLALQAAGMVLRSGCVEQAIAESPEVAGFRAVGQISAPYPDRFDLLAHIGRNHTPFMSYAFPLSVFRDLGMCFDESLHLCEDWDLELRAAFVVGVSSLPDVTAIYRRWASGSSSATLHDPAEWRRTEKAILAKIDSEPHIFPPGTLAAIREATRQRQEWVEREMAALVERNRELEEQALRMEMSQSWRITRPLRAAAGLLRRSHD